MAHNLITDMSIEREMRGVRGRMDVEKRRKRDEMKSEEMHNNTRFFFNMWHDKGVGCELERRG